MLSKFESKAEPKINKAVFTFVQLQLETSQQQFAVFWEKKAED